MDEAITIEDCAGYSVKLLVESGQFVAFVGVESSGIVSYDLNDLRKRLRAMAEKEGQVARKKQSPVTVWIYCRRPGEREELLERVDVVGVVAGRRYDTVLRTLQGQIEPIGEKLVVFHLNDSRASHFAALLANARDLREKLDINAMAMRDFAAASPRVASPIARTKEQALDVESLFLQALREIACK